MKLKKKIKKKFKKIKKKHKTHNQKKLEILARDEKKFFYLLFFLHSDQKYTKQKPFKTPNLR
jgi:hypothetical protein